MLVRTEGKGRHWRRERDLVGEERREGQTGEKRKGLDFVMRGGKEDREK